METASLSLEISIISHFWLAISGKKMIWIVRTRTSVLSASERADWAIINPKSRWMAGAPLPTIRSRTTPWASLLVEWSAPRNYLRTRHSLSFWSPRLRSRTRQRSRFIRIDRIILSNFQIFWKDAKRSKCRVLRRWWGDGCRHLRAH